MDLQEQQAQEQQEQEQEQAQGGAAAAPAGGEQQQELAHRLSMSRAAQPPARTGRGVEPPSSPSICRASRHLKQ